MKRTIAVVIMSLFLLQTLVVVQHPRQGDDNLNTIIHVQSTTDGDNNHKKLWKADGHMEDQSTRNEFGGSWFDDFNDESKISENVNVSVDNGKAELDSCMFKKSITITNTGGILSG